MGQFFKLIMNRNNAEPITFQHSSVNRSVNIQVRYIDFYKQIGLVH